MNRFLINILVVLLPFFMMGQSSHQVHINWSELMSQKSNSGNVINFYSFDDATNLYDFGALPVQISIVKLPSEYFGCEIQVNILTQDTIPKSIVEQLADIDLVSSSVQYQILYGKETADIYVLPFLRTENGYVIRLIDYEIIIDFIPVEKISNQNAVSQEYVSSSVLSSGTWYKMGIDNTGVHKLSYSDLENLGIDPGQLDTKKIGVFGNYNGMLHESNGRIRPDDLLENSISIVGGEDGSFDTDDYILFYAQSSTTWKYNLFTGRFDHFTNLYADTSYYFLTTDAGINKRIQLVGSVIDDPSETVNSFYDYAVHEEDLENLMYSGKAWFGERFTGETTERIFNFSFPNLNTERALYINFEMVARGFIKTYAEVYINDVLVVDSLDFDKVNTSGSRYASLKSSKKTFFADSDKLDVKVKYYSDDPTAIAWLNFLELNAERKMIFTGGQMGFRDPHVSASGNIARYEIEDVTTNVRVWDISDVFNPVEVDFNMSGSRLDFTLYADTIHDFTLFDETDYFKPVEISSVQNQNLHEISDVNFVIISPDYYKTQAQRLAQLHEEVDGLEVIVVSPEEIYNEFSSGSQDVTAIRDFMRMLWKTDAFGDEPGYLLFFGDASFDYKHRIHENTNIVPTYQSDESLRETQSYATDDYFGLLDDDEGDNCRGNLDIGIGRFPVSNEHDAEVAVDKVVYYLNQNELVMRPWRNSICFVADDADHNLHLHQAKYLISTTDTVQPIFNLNKIFSDAYTKVTVPGGKRFPEVNKKIINQVEEGALIVNYTGHGGLISWAEELILDVPTIRGFENIENMPLFITATCEFSRFDNPEFISAGEYLYLNENGGAIALLTTTRLAFAASNIIVNQRIYEHLMEREDGERPRLGDLIRLSKIPSNSNFLNFALLGDPALRLAYPQYNVVTNTVNDRAVDNKADTVHALSLVTINGSVVDHSGGKMTNFNGYVYPKVYDKYSEYTTLGTETDSSPEDFDLMDKILFNGKITVVNGDFEFSFLVPKDISYRYGFGKISYYAFDTAAHIDAWGSYRRIFIGGLDNQAEPDNSGPEIALYLNNENFQSGDDVPINSYFLADLFDQSGIHSTGNSLGRDIALTMDGDLANTMVMNEYYVPDVDTYQSGEVSYLFNGLTDGWHLFTLKAWDLQNNSSETTIDFYVDEYAEILLSNVMNYPNPFSDETYFGFIHNKQGAVLDVQIKIYDINGRFVTQLDDNVGSVGDEAIPIKWDGKDHNGNPLPSGLYTYHILVTDYTGNTTIQRQKMIKLSE